MGLPPCHDVGSFSTGCSAFRRELRNARKRYNEHWTQGTACRRWIATQATPSVRKQENKCEVYVYLLWFPTASTAFPQIILHVLQIPASSAHSIRYDSAKARVIRLPEETVGKFLLCRTLSRSILSFTMPTPGSRSRSHCSRRRRPRGRSSMICATVPFCTLMIWSVLGHSTDTATAPCYHSSHFDTQI